MAGESARESARPQREQAAAAALDGLPKDTWTVFHDVRWPGRRFTNVDHVAVGPAGVFVIDSKNWSGRIGVRRNVLRQNGRAREETVAVAADAALAIAALAPAVLPQHVQPVLCFVRDEALTGQARDVMVCSTGNVADLLANLPVVLSPDVVEEVRQELDAKFRTTAPPWSRPRPEMRQWVPQQAPEQVLAHAPQLAPAHAPDQVPQEAPQQVATAERAPRPPATTPRSAKRRIPVRGLVRLLIGLGLACALLASPQLLTSMSHGVAGLLRTRLVDDTLSGSPAHGVPRRSVPAVVVRHLDGDTLELRPIDGDTDVVTHQGITVRLLEIATPESATPGQPAACHARQASAQLRKLAPVGSMVRVLQDRELLNSDGQALLYVWNDQGDFVNLELVRSGAARTVLHGPNDRYLDQLRNAEQKARTNKRGLWGAC